MYVPGAALQGRSQLKCLAVPQKSTQQQTLSGPVRADARDAPDRPMDAGQHVDAGVGDDDELLVVSVDIIAIAIATAVAPIGLGRGRDRVGPGIVPDVPGEEEGEGPDVRPVGEAGDDLVRLLGLLGGLHLRCLRRWRGLGHVCNINTNCDDLRQLVWYSKRVYLGAGGNTVWAIPTPPADVFESARDVLP